MNRYPIALLTALGGLVLATHLRLEVRRHRAAEERMKWALSRIDERVRQRTTEMTRAIELKDRFLATVSHELRTPLNAIIGWVHVLKSGAVHPSDIGRAIDAIDRNAHAQARLISELLDVSRMMQGRLVIARLPVDLRHVVDDAVRASRPAAEARDLTLEYTRCGQPATVLGDEVRLREVVEQLLANALKFTPPGGRVAVTLCEDGPMAKLRVEDTGAGIEPDALPHLFVPFYQSETEGKRTPGLGLGLAIVRELVSLHDGQVKASSPGIGGGATFEVLLPVWHRAGPNA